MLNTLWSIASVERIKFSLGTFCWLANFASSNGTSQFVVGQK